MRAEMWVEKILIAYHRTHITHHHVFRVLCFDNQNPCETVYHQILDLLN